MEADGPDRVVIIIIIMKINEGTSWEQLSSVNSIHLYYWNNIQ